MGFFDTLAALFVRDSICEMQKANGARTVASIRNSSTAIRGKHNVHAQLNWLHQNASGFYITNDSLKGHENFSLEGVILETSHSVDIRDIYQSLRQSAVLQPQSISAQCQLIDLICGQIFGGGIDTEMMSDCITLEEAQWGLYSDCHASILRVLDITNAKMDKGSLATKNIVLLMDGILFLLRSDFVNALKRFYSSLLWEDLLLSAYCDYGVENGLQEIFIAIIANILQVYLLFGETDWVNHVTSKFQKIITRQTVYEQRCIREAGFGEIDVHVRKMREEYLKSFTQFDKVSGIWIYGEQYPGESTIAKVYYPENNTYLPHAPFFFPAEILPSPVHPEQTLYRIDFPNFMGLIDNIDKIIDAQKSDIQSIISVW